MDGTRSIYRNQTQSTKHHSNSGTNRTLMRLNDISSETDKTHKMWIGIMVFDMHIWNISTGLCG